MRVRIETRKAPMYRRNGLQFSKAGAVFELTEEQVSALNSDPNLIVSALESQPVERERASGFAAAVDALIQLAGPAGATEVEIAWLKNLKGRITGTHRL